MLTKEYRIPLPLSVEEYRIAQLYMIQKKSREESSGSGSGVEIIRNEPYQDGPGGKGQYTLKVYHIGSHLPSWFRSILPKSALRVEEEAWNAYPYTKTIFRCPFVEKFKIEIETVYLPDAGVAENVFNLTPVDLHSRIVDVINFVCDQPSSNDYRTAEDPTIYHSERTGRGPLSLNWLRRTGTGVAATASSSSSIMCAYKLCRVEFKYWGMQSKIEKFIHDTALRKTMLRAHRQAWAWQDEWYGLSLADIRLLEADTQHALAEKMAVPDDSLTDSRDLDGAASASRRSSQLLADGGNSANQSAPQQPVMTVTNASAAIAEIASGQRPNLSSATRPSSGSLAKQMLWERARERPSNTSSCGSKVSWQSIENAEDSSSEEEYYDAENGLTEVESVPKNLAKDSHYPSACSIYQGNKQPESPTLKDCTQLPWQQQPHADYASQKTAILFLVLHGGTVLQGELDRNSVMSDIATLKSTFDGVVRANYPSLMGRYVLKLVACPSFHLDALNLLARLNPYGYAAGARSDGASSNAATVAGTAAAASTVIAASSLSEYFPVSAVPLLAVGSPAYGPALATTASRANKAFLDFRLSDEGRGFCGQVCLIGDCLGALMGFDILTARDDASDGVSLKKYASDSHLAEETEDGNETKCSASYPAIRLGRHLSSPAPHNELNAVQQCNEEMDSRTAISDRVGSVRFDFDVSDFFMLGSPIATVLAHRVLTQGKDCMIRPSSSQLYNLYHCADPSAGRLEPLLDDLFVQMETVRVSRYQRYPLGDGQSISLLDALQRLGKFVTSDSHLVLSRKESTSSHTSCSSVDANIEYITSVARRWWGTKRLDYILYCPEALETFPVNSLPSLFHASYWESTDLVSFILRQLVQGEDTDLPSDGNERVPRFLPIHPREKWLQSRSAMKTKNIGANHRGNDSIILEDQPQTLSARFMYGPLDMVTLSGEMVDIHIVIDASLGEWVYVGSQMTDKYGRIVYTLADSQRLSLGMYPVKMVVRGDHSYADLYLMVLPPHAGCVIFSIDGSFTASMSLMAKDPKVRPGSVDVVRYWQDLGYIIVYVSARPDMQLRKMVTWLAQHNFPHGAVAFMDGLSADPLRQKAHHLKTLMHEAQLDVCAVYGSQKDISVYQAVGMPPEKIYVVGKVSRRATSLAQVLSLGYAAHLQDLMSNGGRVRPCKGNSRLLLQKSCFSLPMQRRKGSTKHHKLLTIASSTSAVATCVSGLDICSEKERAAISVGQLGTTVIDAGAEGGLGNAARVRGRSPRQRSSAAAGLTAPGLVVSAAAISLCLDSEGTGEYVNITAKDSNRAGSTSTTV